MNYNSLDGKRVIFIGNSYVFYGCAVEHKVCEVLTQNEREWDRGYFYQLAHQLGEEVNVTNWTFGGHALAHIFNDVCGFEKKSCKDEDHKSYLLNRYYDYVIISPSSGKRSVDRIEEDMREIREFFLAANPCVKFVCLGNLGAHGFSSFKLDFPEIYNYYPTLKSEGMIIADWGGLVNKLINGEITVDGYELTRDSFIVNRTEKDGFHPNQLAGYITALFAYCAITNRRALGMPFDFATDAKINPEFDTDAYIAEKYCYNGGKTNYLELLKNGDFIRKLQTLVDKTLFGE